MAADGSRSPEAGAPELLLRENGLGGTRCAGEIEFQPKLDVAVEPCLTINQKLIEFRRRNKPFSNNLRFLPVGSAKL